MGACALWVLWEECHISYPIQWGWGQMAPKDRPGPGALCAEGQHRVVAGWRMSLRVGWS